jgi:hypothetical protein
VTLDHRRPGDYKFRQEDIFWVDLCLTPRPPREALHSQVGEQNLK